jgi:hypothetical protein
LALGCGLGGHPIQLTRLPTQLNSRIEELLPHSWQPGA